MAMNVRRRAYFLLFLGVASWCVAVGYAIVFGQKTPDDRLVTILFGFVGGFGLPLGLVAAGYLGK